MPLLFLTLSVFTVIGCSADTSSMVSEGKEAYKAGDYEAARSLYDQACKGGNATGCYEAGDMFDTGKGGAQDKVRARELYDQACKGGYTKACSTGEPSEKEMHAAVAAKFTQVNANYITLGKRCERREFRNDPLLAMQCLTLCGAGGGKCSLSFNLTRFEKLGCGKARGQSGYVCDYVVGFSSSSPFARGAMNRLTGGGDTGQGRFLQRNDGWIFLPMNRR